MLLPPQAARPWLRDSRVPTTSPLTLLAPLLRQETLSMPRSLALPTRQAKSPDRQASTLLRLETRRESWLLRLETRRESWLLRPETRLVMLLMLSPQELLVQLRRLVSTLIRRQVMPIRLATRLWAQLRKGRMQPPMLTTLRLDKQSLPELVRLLGLSVRVLSKAPIWLRTLHQRHTLQLPVSLRIPLKS